MSPKPFDYFDELTVEYDETGETSTAKHAAWSLRSPRLGEWPSLRLRSLGRLESACVIETGGPTDGFASGVEGFEPEFSYRVEIRHVSRLGSSVRPCARTADRFRQTRRSVEDCTLELEVVARILAGMRSLA